MFIKKLFKNLFPSVIKEYRSRFNGIIRVVMAFNQPRLMIGGMIQSGGLVRKLWETALAKLSQDKPQINNVLILGLGCGDCAFSVQKYFPQAQMTGVEIDNQVIEAARCYFSLATVKNLKIAIADAADYVKNLGREKNAPKFDLVLLDVYLGKNIPQVFTTKAFFQSLTKIISHDAVVIYNHLFFKQHKAAAQKLIKQMETVFGKITLVRTASNLLIFGWY